MWTQSGGAGSLPSNPGRAAAEALPDLAMAELGAAHLTLAGVGKLVTTAAQEKAAT
jgi:hypothetical protein